MIPHILVVLVGIEAARRIVKAVAKARAERERFRQWDIVHEARLEVEEIADETREDLASELERRATVVESVLAVPGLRQGERRSLEQLGALARERSRRAAGGANVRPEV